MGHYGSIQGQEQLLELRLPHLSLTGTCVPSPTAPSTPPPASLQPGSNRVQFRRPQPTPERSPVKTTLRGAREYFSYSLRILSKK